MLIPRKTTTIESSKSVEQVVRTLRCMTDDSNSVFRINDRSKLFYGKIEPPAFRLHSIPEDYLRGILLQINVELRRKENGVAVDLDVRPWRYERVFAAIYYSFSAFLLLLGIFLIREPLVIIIPAVLFVFCFLLIRFTFDHLYKKLITLLSETLH